MRTLTEMDVRNMAIGAAVLGTGGGGNPHIGMLTVLEVMRQGYEVKIADAKTCDPNAPAVALFGIGAPTVGMEKVRAGNESLHALRAYERHTNQKAAYIAPIEVGGANSMLPLALGALASLPVLDLDGMGRAFPEVQMVTYSIYGISASPLVLADERGNTTVLETQDDPWMEKLARSLTAAMGGHADAIGFAATVGDYVRTGIPNTLTLAEEIGQILKAGGDVWSRLLNHIQGKILFEGKITDLKRRTTGGFARGEARIDGIGLHKNHWVRLIFQNENLVLFDEHNTPLATVPDLITVLDYDTAIPLTTEVLRYGLRVRIIGIPCHTKWRTEKALKVAGPKAFGYDLDYVPM